MSMTMHTPVVFTDDAEVADEARSRHWPVVRRDCNILHLTGVAQTAPLPEPSMRIEQGSLEGETATGWKFILDWVAKHIHRPMLVVEPNGYAQDLALWAASSRGWPMAAWVNGDKPVVAAAGAVSLIATGVGVLAPAVADVKALLPGWRSTVSELPATALVPVHTRPAPSNSTRKQDTTRVLLVAYYAGDNPTVGVQRPTYWFEMLEELSGGDITVDLATATPWADAPERVHFVPDHGVATLAPGNGPIEPWAAVALSHAREKAYAPTRHIGGYWQLALERWFAARDDHYDVVVITGDPFEYFGFASFAQKHWYARTVLDYRDPFALNPRRSFTDESKAQALDNELGWNLAADVVTVVHERSRETVVLSGPEARVEVISNGYDERVPAPTGPEKRTEGALRIGHAGQFFPQTPPDNLLAALAEHGAELHHWGRELETTGGAAVTQHGRHPRAKVLDGLTGVDIGVAWITGRGVEMPTKVFDYLVAGLEVLVLHQGEASGSALHDLLADVEGVHFVPDEQAAITAFLAGLAPRRHSPERAVPFSRRAATQQFVGLLRELGDNTFRR